MQQERAEARTSANETAVIAVVGSAGIFALLAFATSTIEKATRQRHELIVALKDSEGQLRKSRDWFRITLVSIGDAVIATDGRGRITLMNNVAQAVTGWKQEEAAGKPLEQVLVIRNEETGREVENPVSKVLREGRAVGLANHTELVTKDGRCVPIDDSAAPFATGTAISTALFWCSAISARGAPPSNVFPSRPPIAPGYAHAGAGSLFETCRTALSTGIPARSSCTGFLATKRWGRSTTRCSRRNFPRGWRIFWPK